MSNYTKATNFASKDALLTGNPLKIVKGTEIDNEFNAIATAVSTKLDTSALAAPGPIGNVTASTGSFSTLTATNGAGILALNADNLGSGTVPNARFPATLPAASGVNLTDLNASNLGSGTIPDARFPATLPATSGANLTSLPAGNLTGNVPKAAMATNLNASGSAPFYVARAWANFNGTGTIAIRASGNVLSLTDNGVGDYTVTFTTAMPDADYAPVGLMALLSGNEIRAIGGGVNYAQTTSSLRVQTWSSTGIVDAQFVNLAIFR